MKKVVCWKNLDNVKQMNFNARLPEFAFLEAGNVTVRLIAMVAAMNQLESVVNFSTSHNQFSKYLLVKHVSEPKKNFKQRQW